MPTFRFVVVDVFTDTPLQGNQLGVFTDARGLDTATMQALALELGFAETTFVLPAERGGHARIRIFNPGSEMAFAGHPTLGTAFVLTAPLQLDVIELETGAGIIPVALERDTSGRIAFGRMRQNVPDVTPFPEPERLLAAVGVERSELPIEVYDNGTTHAFVALASKEAVSALTPDTRAVSVFGLTGVNCFAGTGSAWKTRMFWSNGEDAATGSAAGPLACHLARHGWIGWGNEIVITQGVELGRRSTLHARADGGEGGIEGVEVGGSAVVVARGEFALPV